jgi:hypothetical protein
VGETYKPKPQTTANIDPATGREVAIDIDKFASAYTKSLGRPYYK